MARAHWPLFSACSAYIFFCNSLALGQVLLEDFSSRRLNGEGTFLFDSYNGENPNQVVVYPGSDGSFPLGGKTLQIGVGAGTNPVIYLHFLPRFSGYSYPGSYVSSYLKSGVWNENLNRLSFWLKSSKPTSRSSSGSDSYQFGTYIREHDNPDSAWAGAHYYHLFSPNVYADRWFKVWVNRTPQHQVGQSSSTNWGEDPSWSSQGVHYFDGLTRFYWDGAYTQSPNSIWRFACFELMQVLEEPDAEVSSIAAMYSGTRYEITWAAIKNTQRSFQVRYNAKSMKANGFASGTDGGQVQSPGSNYVGTFWASAPMGEGSPGMYFAIKPTHLNSFTEIYLPNLNSSAPAIPSSPSNLRLQNQ